MGRFDGKVVLITGGARGQGRSHALAFAREGADVAFCDITEQPGSVPYPTSRRPDLDETVKLVEELDRRCVAVRADVRDRAQVQEFADRARTELGRIDVLLANAGIFSFGTVTDMSEDMWQEMIAVNLTGVYHAFRAVLPTMVGQGYGRIVATSSMAGKTGMGNIAHYVAAKWGVIGLVKSTAIEVAGNGVTVNAVCPTSVDTDMIQNPAAYALFVPGTPNPTRDDAAPVFQSLNPVPVPWVEASDISNTMLYLASDEARYVTGETVAVAAGMNASNTA